MESTVIQHMVDNILMGKNTEAMDNFGEVISAKVSDALDARRIEIASTLGQTETENEE
jgi:hypothetical protein